MRTFLAVLCGLAFGCHDAEPLSTPDAAAAAASGLDPSRSIASLDAAERMQFCEWSTNELGGPGVTQVCNVCTGDACTDYNVTVNTVEMCLAQLQSFAICGASVGEQEACMIAQAPDLCAGVPACISLERCL